MDLIGKRGPALVMYWLIAPSPACCLRGFAIADLHRSTPPPPTASRMTAIGSHRHDYGSTRGTPDCWHRLASVDATRPCGPRPATEPRGRDQVPAPPFPSGLPSSARSSPVGPHGSSSRAC